VRWPSVEVAPVNEIGAPNSSVLLVVVLLLPPPPQAVSTKVSINANRVKAGRTLRANLCLDAEGIGKRDDKNVLG
jgi:hypothetical protein